MNIDYHLIWKICLFIFSLKFLKNMYNRYKIIEILEYNDKKINKLEKEIRIILDEFDKGEFDNYIDLIFINVQLEMIYKLTNINNKIIDLFHPSIKEVLERYHKDTETFNIHYKKMQDKNYIPTESYFFDLVFKIPSYYNPQFISKWLMIFTGKDYKIENKFRKWGWIK